MSQHDGAEAVLTLRKRRCGLKSLRVSDEVEPQSPGAFRVSELGYVLFVHGYNNSHEEARRSYAEFRWWLKEYRANARVLELHWPGDSVYGVGWASYWRHVRTAQECGKKLAKWITQAAGARFLLIGHSMGCRLILETLENLAPIIRRHRISGVCLMAAAVPVNDVKSGSLGPRKTDPASWRVLYSKGDLVLKVAFRAGQPLALDSLVSRAVGLDGEPESLWNVAPTRARIQMTECDSGKPKWRDLYGHGWYWRGGRRKSGFRAKPDIESLSAIEAAKGNRGKSAKAVAELLGAVISRELPSRLLPFGRPLTPPRTFWSRPD